MRDGLSPEIGSLAVAGALAVAVVCAMREPGSWRPEPVPPPPLASLWDQRVDTLRRGETLGELFSRQGLTAVPTSLAGELALFDPRRLKAGLVFNFLRRAPDSVPSRVVFRDSPDHRVVLVRSGDSWRVLAEPVRWQAEPVTFRGEIRSSLYDALAAAAGDSLFAPGDGVRLAWDLADIFAWQVDFSRDIHPGDVFRVVAERLISEDGEVRYGGVLAGDIVAGGTRYSAFRFTEDGGGVGYYDEAGRSLRRAFLLTPVAFRRISSRMSGARFHPILGILRRHEGTDYTADEGAPVMAAGDGTVARCEWSGGYGNLIEIRHAGGIVTRYGHLASCARGIAAGVTVRQGETIGYVGSTGLATGPHLHYEFRVNGVARNPRDVDPGAGEPIAVARREAFERSRGRLSLLLDGAEPVWVAILASPAEDETAPSAGAAF